MINKNETIRQILQETFLQSLNDLYRQDIKFTDPRLAHKLQKQLILSNYFIRVWLSSRRTGKTKCIILNTLETIDKVAPNRSGHILMVYPTKEKGIDLIYEDLYSALDSIKWVKGDNYSKGIIRTINKTTINFMGLRSFKDAEKLRSWRSKAIQFDECQSMIGKVFLHAIGSPASSSLADFSNKGAHIACFGTPPESIGHEFSEMFEWEGIEKINCAIDDNPFLDPKGVEKFKKEQRRILSIPQDIPEKDIKDPIYLREVKGKRINNPERIIFNRDYFPKSFFKNLPMKHPKDQFNIGAYISPQNEMAISINATNETKKEVYCIYEKEKKIYFIGDLPKEISQLVKAFELDPKQVSVYFSYPKASEEIASILSRYYDTSFSISEEFEKKYFAVMIEKININMRHGAFKLKEDSLTWKAFNKVFWNEERTDIDETVPSPIIYAQLLSWSGIVNLPMEERKIKIIDDPSEIVRLKKEAKAFGNN